MSTDSRILDTPNRVIPSTSPWFKQQYIDAVYHRYVPAVWDG